MSVKSYKDYKYSRALIDDPDIKDVVMGELGLNESDLIDGLVFDGKVVPTVSLNSRSMCYWNQDEVSVVAAATDTFWIWGEFDMRVDAAGEVSIEQRIQGNWYEMYHLGGASADVAVNVKVFGANTRILGVAANSTVRYIGMVYASALVGL